MSRAARVLDALERSGRAAVSYAVTAALVAIPLVIAFDGWPR